VKLVEYATMFGWAVARAHAKAGDAAMIVGYPGSIVDGTSGAGLEFLQYGKGPISGSWQPSRRRTQLFVEFGE
jgi:hypothetical protein